MQVIHTSKYVDHLLIIGCKDYYYQKHRMREQKMSSNNHTGMFAKYLRKEHGFWRLKADSDQICYCKHSAKYGGIYAYIESGTPGVKIVANGFMEYFTDFSKLSMYLDQLEQNAERNHNGLVSALYRSANSRMLRTMTL
jgi:hypothetical protein